LVIPVAGQRCLAILWLGWGEDLITCGGKPWFLGINDQIIVWSEYEIFGSKFMQNNRSVIAICSKCLVAGADF
jgi:hypothetical protein